MIGISYKFTFRMVFICLNCYIPVRSNQCKLAPSHFGLLLAALPPLLPHKPAAVVIILNNLKERECSKLRGYSVISEHFMLLFEPFNKFLCCQIFLLTELTKNTFQMSK
jgi:hypothetical protein